jgi:hypothetical protein
VVRCKRGRVAFWEGAGGLGGRDQEVWCGLALDMGPRIAEWEILWYRLRLLGYSRRGLLDRVVGNGILRMEEELGR